jgi:hypothetical protein
MTPSMFGLIGVYYLDTKQMADPALTRACRTPRNGSLVLSFGGSPRIDG